MVDTADLVAEAIRRRAIQMPKELGELVDILRERRRWLCIEIGAGYGGTAWLWAQLFNDVVVIDDGAWGIDRDNLCKNVVVWPDDSSGDVRDRLAGRLGDVRADMLFIDGNHSYVAVKNDFYRYSPLVRSGGLVVLHDIASEDPQVDVPALWAEIRNDRCTELIDRSQATPDGTVGVWAGIGIWPVP